MVMIPSPDVVVRDPVLFAGNFLKIQDKNDMIIPLIYNPIQRDYLRNRTPRDLILKPRQIGFSTAIQAELFRYATTRPARTLTLADEHDNTQKLRRMQEKFYDNLPIAKPERSANNARLTVYPNLPSEMMIGTAGNTNVGRVGSYRYHHYSELAHYKDASMIMKSALQGGRPVWVIAESTPNGAQGWFYERCMEALQPDSGSVWTLHFYAWFSHIEYQIVLESGEVLQYDDDEQVIVNRHKLKPGQIKWRRNKIAELGSRSSFLQEYPEDPESCFLVSGRGVFTFSASLFYDDPPTSPEEGHRYVMGVDWGQNPDATVAVVFDSTDYREVALLRMLKRDYDVMIADIARLAAHWGVSNVIPEFNSIGRVTAKMLVTELRQIMPDTMPVVRAFDMTNKRKDDLVKLFQQGILEGMRLTNDTNAKHELRIFQARQTPTGLWTYSHPEGEHDDTVIARLLAHLACYQLRI